MNTYAHLNEQVRIDLEALEFMDSTVFDLPMPPRMLLDEFNEPQEIEDVSHEKSQMLFEQTKRIRTIRELLKADHNIRFSKQAIFEMFDVIDKINHGIRVHKPNESDYLKLNLENICQIAKNLLHEYGISEVVVLHHSFDENTMEIIARLSAREFSPTDAHQFKPGQVVVVHERAFRDDGNGDLLRKAKVTVIH